MAHTLRRRNQVLALLACALAVRLATAVAVQHWVDQTPGRLCLIAGDAEGYWALARSIVERGTFEIYDPPRQILRMPGFPLWLAAGMKVVGQTVLWHRFGLAVIGAAACGMVYALGRLLCDEPTGLVAGWLAALSPSFAAVSTLLLSETLFAATLTSSLVLLALVWNRSGLPALTGATGWLAFASGLAGAAATLVRPTWLPFVPGVAAVLALRGAAQKRIGDVTAAGIVCLGVAAGMAPWVVRNRLACGHPVVTTLWAGPSLYDGLNPQATGESDMRFIETDGVYQRLSEYEADAHYRDAALAFARAHPLSACKLGLIKLGRFWNPLPNASQFGSLPVRLALAAWSVPLFVCAVAGAWGRRADSRFLLLSVGPILFLSAVHTVFIGSVRYRLPAEYPLLVAAAAGARQLVPVRCRSLPLASR